MRNFNESGRSMVEMLGVLAIIGVLSAGGLAGYSKAMFKHKLNTTMDQITMLVTNIRTMYGTQKSYADLDNDQAFKLGIIPPAIATALGGPYRNPFKGNVVISGKTAKARSTAPVGTAFIVQYTGLPTEACIALATADFGSGAGSGFIGVTVDDVDTPKIGEGDNDPTDIAIYIGDGAGKTADGATAATKLRGEGEAYQMSAAITACSGATNNITWKFY